MADESLFFRLRVAPDMTSLDEATAAIGRHIETAGVRTGNALIRALHYPTLGMGSGALAGGIAGGRMGGFLGGVGGAVGGAFGLHAGAAGAGLGALANYGVGAAGQGLGAMGNLAVKPLEGLAHGLRELQGPLSAVGLGLDTLELSLEGVGRVVKSIPVVGSLLGPLSDVLTGIPNLLKDVTNSLVNMARGASPGVFHTWQVAIEDVQGVIGRTFVPVLELMRDGVRLFGDVLANILPNEQESREALAALSITFQDIGQEVRAFLQEFGPGIRGVLIDALRGAAYWASVAARALWDLVKPLMGVAGGGGTGGRHGGFFGGGTTGALDASNALRSSQGAWARPASITTAESYQQQLQVAALSQPRGMSEGEKQTKALLDLAGIETDANKLRQNLEKAFSSSKDWLEKNWKTVETAAAATAETAKKFAKFADWVYDRFNIGEKVSAGRQVAANARASDAQDEYARQQQAQGRLLHWHGQGRPDSGLPVQERIALGLSDWASRAFGR